MGDNLQLFRDRKTEQLNKRHKERQLQLEVSNDKKNRETSHLEDVEYFELVFEKRLRTIENIIDGMEVGDPVQLAIQFNTIQNSLNELQTYLSNSTLFLSDYTIQKSQKSINELVARNDESRAKLVPKKKFGFRTRSAPLEVEHINNNKSSKELATNQTVDNRHANKKQPTPKFEWTVSERSGEHIRLEGTTVDGQDLTISHLTDCFVEIHGHPGSLQMSHIINCTILCGPVARSVFADNCRATKLAVACQQLRLHVSESCDIYLHVTCRAIIEDCSAIAFAPYNLSYDDLDVDWQKSGLDRTKNNWHDVADFNWLSPDKPSPNWCQIAENDGQPIDWETVKINFRNRKTQ